MAGAGGSAVLRNATSGGTSRSYRGERDFGRRFMMPEKNDPVKITGMVLGVVGAVAVLALLILFFLTDAGPGLFR